MKFLVFYFFIILSTNLLADCPYNIGATYIQDNNFLGCREAEIALKADPDYEKKFKKNLNANLAKKVAKQSIQILEDLAITSSFYENNGQSFFVDNAGAGRVSKSCKFDFIKVIEKSGCSKDLGLETIENAQEKLRMIASVPDFGGEHPQSLWGSILDVYSINKIGYTGKSEENSCPLRSALPLNAQITEDSAKYIIEKFNNDPDGATINSLFVNYPQLALIKDSGLKDEFQKYIKSYTATGSNVPDSAKKYLSGFFLNPQNTLTLANGVAEKCERMNSSLKRFICQPIDKMIPTQKEISKKIFNNYDISKTYDDQREAVKTDPESFKTYAYLCMEKKTTFVSNSELSSTHSKLEKNKNTCSDYKHRDQSVDDFYNCFDNGMRTSKDQANQNDTINAFCERYRCHLSPDEITTLGSNSCKEPGPIETNQLEILAKNNDKISNEVYYMKTLRAKKANSSQSTSDIASTSPNAPKKKLNLSAFDLNAFGAEEVMKLEHIPMTKEMKTAVAQEMKEKGIDPSSSTSENKKVASIESNFSEKLSQAVAATPAPTPAQSQAAATTYTTVQTTPSSTPAPVTPVARKIETPVSTADTSTSKATKDNQDKLDNVQQMVSDLDKIMKSGSAKSPSAPVVPEAEKVPAVDPSLASWARNLAAKEAALRARESYADAKDAELWRRESDLHNIESRGPAAAATAPPQHLSAANGTKDDSTKSAIKLKQDAIADMNASSTGVTLTPDKLGQMDKSGLKELGVNINEPFIISVKLNGKLIHVRVAKITSQGKTFLAPRLNEDNKEIKEAVLKSPVFNDFRQYYQQISLKSSDSTKI